MPKEREILLQCIQGHEMELSLDSKGTHVLQKFISCSTEDERGNVDETLLSNLPKLINDSFGVCVIISVLLNIVVVLYCLCTKCRKKNKDKKSIS